MTLRAIVYTDRAQHRADQKPGSIWFTDPGDGGVCGMWFWCPCGCGMQSRVTVGVEHKPHMEGPSWNWNGSTEAPTLKPSVNIHKNTLCPGWHGWLTDGYWSAC